MVQSHAILLLIIPSFKDFHIDSEKLHVKAEMFMETVRAQNEERRASEHNEADSQGWEQAD